MILRSYLLSLKLKNNYNKIKILKVDILINIFL